MISEVGAAAGRGRGADLGQPILARHDLLVVEMAAFLGEALVLDMDAGDPARLVFAHRAHGVELVAVAGIGVGDDRQVDRGGDAAGVVDHLRHRHQAEIGVAERRRGAGAGHVDAVEPGALDQPRGDAVIGAGRDHHAVAPQQLAKPLPPASCFTSCQLFSQRLEPSSILRPASGRLRRGFAEAIKRCAGRPGGMRVSLVRNCSEAMALPNFIRRHKSGRALLELGLNPQFIALGYALFLNEEEFAALAAAMPMCIPYDEARRTRRPLSSRLPVLQLQIITSSGIGMTGGLDGGSP